MKSFLPCLALLLFIPLQQSCSEKQFWDTPKAFLAQAQPNDEPQIFGKGLLIDSGIVLGRVAFTNDGKEFYYSYARHWFDNSGTGIRRIVFDGQQWKKSEIIYKDLNNPTLSTDNKTLYYAGGNSDVWKSERRGDGWSEPVQWLSLEKSGLYNFMPTGSGNYYAGSNGDRSNRNDYGAYDFSIVNFAGKDTLVKSLDEILNTKGFDGDFYIAPDESYIIISAKETPTFECELWISFRKSDRSWTSPVSLGPKINTGLAHRFGQYVSPDGKFLFYTKGTGEQDCNFYWVRFDGLLKQLKSAQGL